jgi:hypothetical protein
VHFATLQYSSLSLHQTPSRLNQAAFFAHLKDGHDGEQAFD